MQKWTLFIAMFVANEKNFLIRNNFNATVSRNCELEEQRRLSAIVQAFTSYANSCWLQVGRYDTDES